MHCGINLFGEKAKSSGNYKAAYTRGIGQSQKAPLSSARQTIMKTIIKKIKIFLSEPITLYTLSLGLSICLFIIVEALYPRFVTFTSRIGWFWLDNHYPKFVTDGDRAFIVNFVEWFGVFYGFLLPLLLVRTWEQFDRADREFDREADAIKVLLEDILLLDDRDFLPFKLKMTLRLHLYCRHIRKRYKLEHKKENVYLKKHGDNLLQGIRTGYKNLIYRGGGKGASQLEPITTELLERLNDAIDVRGDRISIFRQRLFETLRFIAIITSALWLIPFYFLNFEVGVFGSLLKLGVAALIVLVLTIIDDLDNPFGGTWRINMTIWDEVLAESRSSLYDLVDKASATQKRKEAKVGTLGFLADLFLKLVDRPVRKAKSS